MRRPSLAQARAVCGGPFPPRGLRRQSQLCWLLSYIKKDYEFARNHRYYMEARLVIVNDQYAFDESQREIRVEEFTDVVGRQFKQPKGGLGYDNSPVAHMWRSIINPDRPL